jgi:hypothetical protein
MGFDICFITYIINRIDLLSLPPSARTSASHTETRSASYGWVRCMGSWPNTLSRLTLFASPMRDYFAGWSWLEWGLVTHIGEGRLVT